MAKELRYMGEFLSREGVTWRVEIRQEADEPYEEVGSLTFEADQALTIEWPEKQKDEVICGSTATIRIVSPGDRTYEDLYSIEVGSIRMDVYRNEKLYWSGMLDPEFYEEPYEQAANYEVSLSFSDFGILQRKKYALAGMLTVEEVFKMCLRESGIIHNGIDQSLISTGLYSSTTALELADLTVRSDNFYDEDGEASTLEDVLIGILQPLGLRMVQRCGKIYVYDLNGLYEKGSSVEAIWSADSSTMGVDVVYNNAKITWSTYAQSGNLAPETCWPHEVDVNLVNINSTTAKTYKGSSYFSYHYSTDLLDWADATDAGFTLWLNKTGENAELVSDYATFFKIVQQYDGSEAEGIALLYPVVQAYKVGTSKNYTAQATYSRVGINPAYMQGTAADIGDVIFRSSKVWIPPTDKPGDLLMRISLEMLLDPRWNPYEEGSNYMKYLEQKDWVNQWKARGNFLYVPVTIKFKPDGSDTIYCWDNRDICKQGVSSPIRSLSQTLGSWVVYDTTKDAKPDVWGWLCYYDASDREESSGVAQGWKANRPAINPHIKQMASILENADDGQYIPYPTQGGGELWVEVRIDGWQISDGGKDLSTTSIIDSYNLFYGDTWRSPKVNWILCKLPQIEIVNNVQFEAEINTDDVEYNAQLNAAAKDALEIDTVCGTKEDGVPTARGAYFNTSSGKQVTQLSRAGRTATAEQLFIGTLYSQFAERRTKLSGEIELHPDALVTYTEQNQGDKKFILVGETQDCITDTTEATIIELRPDEYDKE